MDSISTARDFFINQQGLSPDQADMIVSKGMEAYNQQSQPQQNMMQMASGGIARLGYQMGGSPMGVGTMPMDYGQSLQVPQQMPTNFSSAQSITSNPLLNYGQPQLGTAGGTPLSMNRGGIARLGYQMGGEAVMPDMSGTDMSQIAQMDPQQALTLILQMLIEKGIPLEEAQKLAQKIIELFAQGGAPAVKEFAEQLKQQEQSQAMASGGIAGYAKRQGYFLGGVGDFIGDVVGGIGDAVGDIIESPIGQILLTTAAVYFGGPMLASGLGISSAAGAALAGGLANSALQLASGQKFDPLKALISAGGAYAGAGGFSGAETGINPDIGGIPDASQISNVADYVSANPTSSLATAQQLTNPAYFSPTEYAGPVSSITSGPTYFSPTELTSTPIASTGLEGQVGTGYATPPPNQPFQLQGVGNTSPIDMNPVYNDYSYPGPIDKLQTSASNFGADLMNKAQTGIQNLYNDPLGTIGDLAGSAYNTVKKNIVPLGLGFAAGIAAGSPQQPNESDEDFARRRKEEVNLMITKYGKNLKIKNRDFYENLGATYPTFAAQGGIMGYKQGGSMVPPARQIEGGIIELDARKTGGYIPYGKKERVDDVPAMLAKDEFVFTSRAVKAAGGGSARRGAAKMYALMKQLEGARV
jgi:hypothetical protein